jgi:hypothetical protein
MKGIPIYAVKNFTMALHSTLHDNDIYKCRAYQVRPEKVYSLMAFFLKQN